MRRIKIDKTWTGLMISFLILWGCENDTSLPQFHYDYFPTDLGHYVTYNVTEINHDINSDTSNYQIKEVIDSQFIDDENDKAYKIKRYERDSTNDPWNLKDVWWKKIDDQKAIQYEENIPFVKMVFAPKNGKEWNGNAQNNKQDWKYVFKKTHESYSFNGHQWDSTVFVNQRNFTTLVDFQIAREVYAKDIGLVKKYYKNLIIEQFDSTNISNGREIYMNYIDHGQE